MCKNPDINLDPKMLEGLNTEGQPRPHRDAIENIQQGEILVIDACSSDGAGVVGDMFTRRVMELGGTGIVIPGRSCSARCLLTARCPARRIPPIAHKPARIRRIPFCF